MNMKRKTIIAIGLLCAMGAFAQDFPAYLKMEGTVITGCDKAALPASLVIPEGVTEIGESAFEDCTSLKSVSIPASVAEVGSSAFSDCKSLVSVTMAEGVKIIANDAFYDCKSLASVTLPKTLAEIGPDAFLGCESLKSISIPMSVTKIGTYAFLGILHLTVQYDGTKEQWEEIEKDDLGWGIGTFAVRCSDGKFRKQNW